MPELCAVCHTEPGPLCDTDLKVIDRQLRDLPARLLAVAGALTPGRAPAAERVGTSTHVHAALPARVAALSLVGPGGDVPVPLHPLMRHWAVKRKVQVTTHVVGIARMATVEVTDWFHELVVDDDGRPVMVPENSNDQIGVVPPREWLDQQVRRWRAHFRHHVPPRTMLGGIRPYIPPAWLPLLHLPQGPQMIGLLAAAHQAHGGLARLAYRGLLTEPGARAAPDPVVAELEQRARPGTTPRTIRWDVDYLRTWLPEAAGQDTLNIGVFAAQLATLHAEISRALGDTPDHQWLGRCPAFLTEYDPGGEPTGRKKPCGGGLWQDNTAFCAQVQCPRCQMTWDTRGNAGAGTAREIRRVWPVDRRRRYTAREIDRIIMPKCPACGNRVSVNWQEVTGNRDKQRTWKPVTATCPSGCDQARRVL
jgi:ssDNA-binding Zn-finger/Zn-ribbon topoisomerase 1